MEDKNALEIELFTKVTSLRQTKSGTDGWMDKETERQAERLINCFAYHISSTQTCVYCLCLLCSSNSSKLKEVKDSNIERAK